MKFFIVFLLFTKILFSQDLQFLLDKYKLETSNLISERTKKESLGHLVTFTQQDLEMMNANLLKDVLKTLPKISMQTNIFGIPNLTYAGNPNSTSTSMRVYIDDQEVSSVQTLSPWLLFADYPLDHISHIDIYYGESTVLLGNEPAKLTVKLYTKNPYTINGGALKNSLSSFGSRSTSMVFADEFENSSLLFMINSSKIDNPTINLKNGSIQNDSRKEYGYFAYRKNDYKISGGFATIEKDDFISLAADTVLDSSKSNHREYFVEIARNFNNSNGKTYLSYNHSDKESFQKNEEGLLIVPIIDFDSLNSTMPKQLDEDLNFRKYDVGISNIFEFDESSLFLAGAIKHKEYEIDTRNVVYLDGSTQNDVKLSDLKQETIYTLLSEYSYFFNDSNILITNLKHDTYKKNSDFKDINFLTSRIGYISLLEEDLSLKLFGTKTFTPPSMFEIDFATKENKDLKNENKNIATFEIKYGDKKENISLFLNYLEIKNMILLDIDKAGYVNYHNDFNATGFSLSYEKYFDSHNKIDLNYYSYVNSSSKYGSPRTGGTIKTYQMVDDFSFYEELIYKQRYTYNKNLEIKDSFNLSLGINYKISKDLELIFKANNILDDDMDVVYTNYSDMSLFTLPNSTRTYTSTIKWTF